MVDCELVVICSSRSAMYGFKMERFAMQFRRRRFAVALKFPPENRVRNFHHRAMLRRRVFDVLRENGRRRFVALQRIGAQSAPRIRENPRRDLRVPVIDCNLLRSRHFHFAAKISRAIPGFFEAFRANLSLRAIPHLSHSSKPARGGTNRAERCRSPSVIFRSSRAHSSAFANSEIGRRPFAHLAGEIIRQRVRDTNSRRPALHERAAPSRFAP